MHHAYAHSKKDIESKKIKKNGANSVLRSMYSPLSHRQYHRCTDDVLHERRVHPVTWNRSCHKAIGLHPASPTGYSKLRLVFGLASVDNRASTFHGSVCKGRRVSKLLCKRVCGVTCIDGNLEI